MNNRSKPALFGRARPFARAFLFSIISLVMFAAGPASALVIHPVWDSSVTSSPNAAAIEADFQTVASIFQSEFSNPVTVNVSVGWGEVDGSAVASGELGESSETTMGYYSYAQVSSDLKTFSSNNPLDLALAQAVAHLPSTAPAGPATFVIPRAEAKALGLFPPNATLLDGSVGFSSKVAFDFNPANGITAGQYDLESVMTHELSEVLGRITGLQSTSPLYRTPLDLFRYASSGKLAFSFSTPAYFSVNGGATHMGDFNDVGSGDRGDWLASTTGRTDLQSATSMPGLAYGLSVADLALLDALGWGGSNLGDTYLSQPAFIVHSFDGQAVPEPGSWMLVIGGLALVGAGLRRRSPMLSRAPWLRLIAACGATSLVLSGGEA